MIMCYTVTCIYLLKNVSELMWYFASTGRSIDIHTYIWHCSDKYVCNPH